MHKECTAEREDQPRRWQQGVYMMSEAHKDATGAQKSSSIRPKRSRVWNTKPLSNGGGTLGLTRGQQGPWSLYENEGNVAAPGLTAPFKCGLYTIYTWHELWSATIVKPCWDSICFLWGFFHFYSTGTKAILYIIHIIHPKPHGYIYIIIIPILQVRKLRQCKKR